MSRSRRRNGGEDSPQQDRPSREPPVERIRAGRLTASVWRNQHESGGSSYAVTLTRSYKDGEDNWKETGSLFEKDLLPAAQLLTEAWSAITQDLKPEAKTSDTSDQF